MDTRGHQLSPTYNEKKFCSLFGLAEGTNLLSAVNIFLIPCQCSGVPPPPDNGDVNYV